MKKFLLLTAGLALGMSAMAQTQFSCVADTWIRENNTTWKQNGSWEKVEIRKDAVKDDAGETIGYATFAGLFGFDFSVPAGMRVQSATVRVVTERWKGCPIEVYGYGNNFEESATWESEENYLSTALAGSPVATFTPAAQRNVALGSDAVGDDYRDISAWTNEIDVTPYVMSVSPLAGRVNFLLVPAEDNINQNCFFTREATEVINAKDATLVFAAEDLVPVLTVTFVEDADVETVEGTSVADTWIRSNNTSWKQTSGYEKVEIRKDAIKDDAGETIGYATFAGLFGFTLNVPQDMEVTGATLRIVTERWKGCPIEVYGYSNNFEESASWDTEGAYVETALDAEPVATFTPAAQRNVALGTDAVGDDYRDISAWTNLIDVTDYVKAISTVANGRVNFLLVPAEDNINQNCFFTREATDIVNAKDATLTFAAKDLVPQLTVTLVKVNGDDEDDPAAVEVVIDLNAPVEYYNLNGVRVVNPDKGIYIVRQGNVVKKVVL